MWPFGASRVVSLAQPVDGSQCFNKISLFICWTYLWLKLYIPFHLLPFMQLFKGKGAFLNVFTGAKIRMDRSALILLFHQIIYDFYLSSVIYSFQMFIIKLKREIKFKRGILQMVCKLLLILLNILSDSQ